MNDADDKQRSDTENAYDVAFESAVADIVTIKSLLMDNRPLEALQVANEAEERHKPNLPERTLQMETYHEDTDEFTSNTGCDDA